MRKIKKILFSNIKKKKDDNLNNDNYEKIKLILNINISKQNHQQLLEKFYYIIILI